MQLKILILHNRIFIWLNLGACESPYFFLQKYLDIWISFANFADEMKSLPLRANENDLSASDVLCVAALASGVEFLSKMRKIDFLMWLIFGDRKRTLLFGLAAVFDYLTIVSLCF